MKKVYIAPQTEAIQLLGENAIMAGSGGQSFIAPNIGIGSGTFNGEGQ